MNKFPEKEILYSTLKRYFYGESTKEENEKVQAWLNEPSNKFRVDQFLRMLWKEIESNPDDPLFDKDALLERIYQIIKKHRKEEEKPQPYYANNFSISMTGVLLWFRVWLKPDLWHLWQMFSSPVHAVPSVLSQWRRSSLSP